jgi:CMP-N-acetylneuraminic acid synthetase
MKLSHRPGVLCIVPARSGSKGVPNKNIRPLLGKPLMGWTIEAARRATQVTRVICSTDSAEYAEIARQYGAETPFLRPAELARDTTVDIEVLTHAVSWLAEHEQYRPDIIIRLQPTNPTFPSELIDRGVEALLNRPDADSSRAVTLSPKHPFKMWRLNDGASTIAPFFPKSVSGFDEPFNMGRQQLPKAYVQVGALDVLRHETLMGDRSMAGKIVVPVIVENELQTIDVDSELDFLVAEQALKILLLSAHAK